MPKLDGTGPQGLGPKTGRGFGNCQYPVGRFCRQCPLINGGKILTKEEQKKLLMEEKKAIEQELTELGK
jgi:hypothetical protein